MPINPTGTGVVSLNSDLARKKWVTDGLLQKAATSFWAAYKGTSREAVIMSVNDISKGAGHHVIFDMDGALAGKPVRGKQQAEGTGEQKKKFSDKITVDRYRYVVDNGDKFDGINIADLSINEHADSRAKLGDLWIRSSDQAFFDLGQQTSEFGVNLGSTFEFDHFLELEHIAKTGQGFTHNKDGFTKRAPIEPFRLADGRPMWLLLIDVSTKIKLLSQDGAQRMFQTADVRGNSNRLFSGVIGTIGNFIVVEAPLFFGNTTGKTIDSEGYYRYDSSAVYAAGLKQYVEKDGVKYWTGDKDFETKAAEADAKIFSRSLLLGKGAFQFAMGKQPDYHFASHDFNLHSESALEVWCGAKSAQLYAENEDYDAVKLTGYNYGCTFVDLQVKGPATAAAAAQANVDDDETV